MAAHARRLYEAGVKRVDFGTPQGLTSTRGLTLLCDRVLPLLRADGTIP
jgi:5,10-methylenetetrahydromethanopterin reductase